MSKFCWRITKDCWRQSTSWKRTYKVRQDEIKAAVATETAKKGFELRLDGLGPYDVCEYSRNGRDLLIAGRKGHVATFDWRDGKLGCELQLNETVRDARWLHVSNQKNFAVAQKKCVYIYGGDGVELHQLKNHSEATHLEYLPYHFLLSSVSTAGIIRYTDVSTVSRWESSTQNSARQPHSCRTHTTPSCTLGTRKAS